VLLVASAVYRFSFVAKKKARKNNRNGEKARKYSGGDP